MTSAAGREFGDQDADHEDRDCRFEVGPMADGKSVVGAREEEVEPERRGDTGDDAGDLGCPLTAAATMMITITSAAAVLAKVPRKGTMIAAATSGATAPATTASRCAIADDPLHRLIIPSPRQSRRTTHDL